MKFKVYYKIDLNPSTHKRTGKTNHYRDDKLIEFLPTYLQIEDNPDVENEVYLIHYDYQGNDMADTLHDSIKDAMEQAEWEFSIKDSEWTSV